jgi:hypothetical protein
LPAEFGIEWTDPDEFIAYYPPEQEGPACGGQPVGAENAVYCNQQGGDFIAWDEPGLMVPYFEEYGDMANAVILAHEFGHGAQARLGLSEEFPLTIESELQADCFAGAWAGWADEQGLLGENAADQAADAVISVADPEGTTWNDPRRARDCRGAARGLRARRRERRSRVRRDLPAGVLDPGLSSTLAHMRSGEHPALSRGYLIAEILLVLGLSLGRAGVFSVVDFIADLTSGVPLADQTTTLNPSASPRPLLDLTLQLLRIGFALVIVGLVALPAATLRGESAHARSGRLPTRT